MKRTGILLLCTALLLPSYFILAESEVTMIEATIEKETASLDDFILELNGKITVLEENHSYQYDFNDLTIIIDLTKGYSLVNDQPEPYLLTPSELDETVLNIMWHLPTQIENEIYVPIQFIERIFNATYEESTQSFKLKEAVEIEKEEDVVVKPQTKPVIKPVQPTPTPNEDDATEHNPPQTPSTPVTPKPEATPPLPPSKPEQPEIETPPAVVPPVIGEPNEDEEEEVVPPVEESPETPEPTPPVEETPEEPEQPENPNPPIENPETSTPDSVLPEE